MALQRSLGEYLRRLRRDKGQQLQELAAAVDLSVSHLSRIENDNAVPSPDTLVRLAKVLDGDLDLMLQLADCLPREILDRLLRRVDEDPSTVHRSAGPATADDFAAALVTNLDPIIRNALVYRFALAPQDVDGLFDALVRLAALPPLERETALRSLVATVGGQRGDA